VTKKQVAGTDGSIFTREVLVTMQRCISTFETFIKNQPTIRNDSWIPCSEELPEENQEVQLTFKNSAGLHTGEATYKNKRFFYVTDTQFGYYEEVYKYPIAWKPKDAPYQPEGECL